MIFDTAAHRLDAERSGVTSSTQHVAVAGDQNISLHRCAERHDFVGLSSVCGVRPKEFADHLRTTGCASSHHHDDFDRPPTAGPASASAWRRGANVRSMIGQIIASKFRSGEGRAEQVRRLAVGGSSLA